MRRTRNFTQPRISVIIPTLNAAGSLSRCIATLRRGQACLGRLEIIVSDGGSHDGTPECGHEADITIACKDQGRGRQLRVGVEAARSNWLFLVHADSWPAEPWAEPVLAFLDEQERLSEQERCAAYFRFAFHGSRTWSLRQIETAVHLRNRIFALPFGDQGLIISRTHLEAIGGIPDVPLMEDVALVRKIGRKYLHALPATMSTASDRYTRGVLARIVRNQVCLALFFIGIHPRYIFRLYEGKSVYDHVKTRDPEPPSC